MAIEIVDFPMKNGWSFHCYVNVHQRVYDIYRWAISMAMLNNQMVYHIYI